MKGSDPLGKRDVSEFAKTSQSREYPTVRRTVSSRQTQGVIDV
jgi:hypothetical protein